MPAELTLSPLHKAAGLHPQQVAVIWYKDGEKQSISYQLLSHKVLAIGEQLSTLGLIRGSRLACIDANSVELICLYWACIDLGILFCPLSPKFPDNQITALVAQHQLSALWVSDNFQDRQLAAPIKLDLSVTTNSLPNKIDTNYPASIILTSGSSGQPKAAVHSLKNHLASAEGSRVLIPLNASHRWLLSLPVFHIGGLAIINRCTLAAATLVLPDHDCQLSVQLIRDKVTHLSLVSTQLLRLLNQDATSLNAIQVLLLGGGAISSDLLKTVNRLNIPSFTSYGMTEMASQITTGIAKADGCSGQLLPLRELKILDDVIYVKGDTLFMGYLDVSPTQPNNITLPVDSEGWFCTKDRGHWSKEGHLQVLGRSDNMFICGGENIQPEEIEAILKQHPQVSDAIVFPQVDDEFGHLPAAIIKGKIDDIGELESLICNQAARFKRPRSYYPWPDVESCSLKVSRKQVIEEVLKKSLV